MKSNALLPEQKKQWMQRFASRLRGPDVVGIPPVGFRKLLGPLSPRDDLLDEMPKDRL